MECELGLNMRIAVLIDVDSISEKYIVIVLEEVAALGVAPCRRIYGSWAPQLASCKNCMPDSSTIPMQ